MRKVLLCVAMLLAVTGAARAGEVLLFYEEPCLTCDDGSVLSDALALLDGLYAPETARVRGVNSFNHHDELKAAATAAGVKVSSLELPAAFLPNGVVIAGQDALTSRLRGEYALLIGADDVATLADAPVSASAPAAPESSAECRTDTSGSPGEAFMWYLCTANCESCRAVRPLIDEAAANGLAVRTVSCAADADLARRLFELYRVPQSERYAPCVMIGGAYLAGAEAIEAGLLPAIEQGSQQHTLDFPRGSILPVIIIGAIMAALTLTCAVCRLKRT